MRLFDGALKAISKIRLIEVPNVRKKLIAYTSILVLMLIGINFALFFISEKNSYIHQMEVSNKNLVTDWIFL